MTVGESLAEARSRAGLSVDELSQRTNIRETVIQSIEQDDFDACGGDVYVRGYVRALAGAVGIDAQPLIHEYDQGRGPEADPRVPPGDETSHDLPAVPPQPDATSYDMPAVPVTSDPDATRDDLPVVLDDTSVDLPVITDDMAAGMPYAVASSGGALVPAGPGPGGQGAGRQGPGRQGPGRNDGTGPQPAYRGSGRRGGGWRLAAGVAGTAVVAVVIVAAATGHFSSGSPSSPATGRSTTGANGGTVTGNGHASTSQPGSAATVPALPYATPSAAPSTKTTGPAAGPVRTLPVKAALAFGPDGLGDGDNGDIAWYAITPGSPEPWTTQWYVTPNFGLLKAGTGLLLDLGHPVTVTSVKLNLSGYTGANLELRVGDAPGGGPSSLGEVGSASNVGGTVQIPLTQATKARFLLVWFTLLPPDGAGHYAESVYQVAVQGRS